MRRRPVRAGPRVLRGWGTRIRTWIAGTKSPSPAVGDAPIARKSGIRAATQCREQPEGASTAGARRSCAAPSALAGRTRERLRPLRVPGRSRPPRTRRLRRRAANCSSTACWISLRASVLIGWQMSRNSPLGSLRDGMATNRPLSPLTTRRSWMTKLSSMHDAGDRAHLVHRDRTQRDLRDLHGLPPVVSRRAIPRSLPEQPVRVLRRRYR